ncbi:MAG: hypothetical protein CVU61_15735 [Deltaproteobacteria bacterium HGW-Deltaproteobacteria-19]|jgi:FkbM family methyltransferase|nr:MAG: hypothetical protein CVU61_15735 [Deltaproteobacteria bacterium HGW-Deltaproteobacteria-19]
MRRIDALKQRMKKGLFFLWMSRGRLGWLNFPILCRLPGGGLILAYGDHMGSRFFLQAYLGRPYEDGCQKLIRRLLKPGMTFFDIGANQGFYTMIGARQVGQSGLVVAFEPVPSVMRKLRRNIDLNGYHHVKAEQFAVSRIEGSVDMHVCREGFESLSSLREPAEDVLVKQEILRVSLIPLDDYVEKVRIGRIDLVKIDVEGGELDVLAGGSRLWEHGRPVVLCEIEDKRTNKWHYRASRIIEFLEGYGYRWFEVGTDGTLRIKEPTEEHILFSNYVAVPEERISSVSGLISPSRETRGEGP